MIESMEEFSRLVAYGDAERYGDKEFWVGLEKQYSNYLATLSIYDKRKILVEYQFTLEVFNRNLHNVKPSQKVLFLGR